MNIQVKEGQFKGKPMLEFWDMDKPADKGGDKYPALSFGVKKARIILDHMDAIREFVAAHTEG